ncbi:MAG: hypothetical protein ACKOFI_03525 [Phycisphaerales bacterium]
MVAHRERAALACIEQLFRFGTITGRLEVEPFVAGSFLLGLYRLQEAVMESSS